MIIHRKVREVRYSDPGAPLAEESYSVEDFRPISAYVLLGPPGAGKTTTFEEEAKQAGTYVTARNFNTFSDKPEWHGTTLFIDGLDEIRSGQDDKQTPFDKIRNKIHTLGCPNFRLSCREADWFGAYDVEHLKEVSSDRKIRIFRLEPLSDEDICNILQVNLDIPEPESFIAEAQERGIQGLLTNPQSLEMLTHAVRNAGIWPKTKTETFAKACEILLAEHNKSHTTTTKKIYRMPDLMEASGRICAVQLLTGNTEHENGIVLLEQLSGHTSDLYLRCLQSKLFESMVDGQTAPVHRLVAEFLAARYVARLVDNGLPIARFLSLATGYDGAIVSELRGLAAWLGAQSRVARSEIIRRDPIGAVLYGDAGQFSCDDKYALFKHLKVQVENNHGPIPYAVVNGIGEMITPEMVRIVQEELKDTSALAQPFVFILLKALNNATVLTGLNKLLWQIVRDKTRWTSVREGALNVLVRYRELDHGAFNEFITLVEDIQNGKVEDHEDVLMLHLLDALYPNVIPESKIIEYLKIPANWKYRLDYEYFWTFRLPRKSTPEQLAIILDQLVDRSNQSFENGTHPASFLYKFTKVLLARILDQSYEGQELSRLFDWLGLIMNEDSQQDYYCDQNISIIQEWLGKHPEKWKSLLSISIRHCADQTCNRTSEKFYECMNNEIHYRLFNRKPDDFGTWCLDQAAITRDRISSDWLVEMVAECVHYELNHTGLSHQLILDRLADFPDKRNFFVETLKRFQDCAEFPNRASRLEKSRYRHRYPDWYDHVKPSQIEFRENKVSPVLLHQLAIAYLGGYSNVRGNNPEERLGSILRHDNSLVEDVLAGFRQISERHDLPSYKEILSLRAADRTHYLACPIMVGLEEISDPEVLDRMLKSERFIRLILAVNYSVPMWKTKRGLVDRPPSWLNRLLTTRPAIVAEVLVEIVVSRLRSRKTASPLFDLAKQGYDEVSSMATMPILEKFPANCTSDQLLDLNHLLLAASKFYKPESLLCLVEKKLAKERMNIAQRIHWLIAGLFLSPKHYASRLESYVSGKERRIRFLAKAVSGRFHFPHTVPGNQRIIAITLLIRLLGISYRPNSFGSDSEEKHKTFLPARLSANQVSTYIGQLAKIPSPEATDSIHKLLSNKKLRPWKSHLERAAYHQREIRREDQFRYYRFQQVLDTIDNKNPANATDLAVLTCEKIDELKKEISCANTSDWRQYWNVDNYNRPGAPRPENACRDLLASKLRTKLEIFGIDVQPEGTYANSRRADIRVAYNGFSIPIETKRSCSRDLWSSIKSQLISRYVIDPQSEGNGIYLVFWFGRTNQCIVQPPLSGNTPTSAKELEEKLQETLPDDRIYNIHVCVVDVAKPVKDANGSNV